jgi:hypothetical protein
MADEISDIFLGMKGKPKNAPVEPEGDEVPRDVGRCGMVWVKGCRAIDIERGAEPVVSLQYVYASVRSEFTPTSFWMLFVGLESWKVTVEGRNLRPLYDRMQDHCLRRLRQADRDFGGEEGKPFVTRIKIEDVTPKGK